MWPPVGAEVAPGGMQRRAAAQRQHRRSPGQGRALAEELDPDAVAGEVAVAEQAHDLVVAAAPRSTSAPADGESGTTRIPRRRACSTNHSKSSGGSTGSATTVTVYPWSASHAPAKSQLPRCGSASTAPRPVGHAGVMCSIPAHSKWSRDPRAARTREPEQLVEVAAVGVERRGDGAAQRRRRRSRVRAHAAGCARPDDDVRAMNAGATCARPRASGSPTGAGTTRAISAPARYA